MDDPVSEMWAEEEEDTLERKRGVASQGSWNTTPRLWAKSRAATRARFGL